MIINMYECPICLSKLERPWESKEITEKLKWVRDEERRKLVRKIEVKKWNEITCPGCRNPRSEQDKFWIEDIVVTAIYNLDEIWEDDSWRPFVSRKLQESESLVHLDVKYWNECIDEIERDVLHKWNDWIERRDDIGAVDPR